MQGIFLDTRLLTMLSFVCFWIGGIIIVRALFLDRSHGRRRCPRCWYDLRESPTSRCSECGHLARDERELHRARRHWRRASVGVIVLIVVPAFAWIAKVNHDGVWRSAPDTVLLGLMWLGVDTGAAVGDGGQSAAATELVRRVGGERRGMWAWQRRLAYEIAASRTTDLTNSPSTRVRTGMTPNRGRRAPPGPLDQLMLNALDRADIGQVDLIGMLAHKRPVHIELIASALHNERDRPILEIHCTPTFPHLKYRVHVQPSVPWLRSAQHTFAGTEAGYAIMSVSDDAPSGKHEVAFDIQVEFASLGLYGSYGPEEFGPYQQAKILVTLTISERANGVNAPK